MLPLSALQSFTARSITVCRTACRSNVDRAIVWITSWSAASRSSALSSSAPRLTTSSLWGSFTSIAARV